MKKISKSQLVSKLKKLGYKIEEESSFNYFNIANEEHWKARSCYIIEIDTGLSFANVNARRDNDFNKLQEFRDEDVIINGRRYEL
jgi:signal recognition particle subunit SEC65